MENVWKKYPDFVENRSKLFKDFSQFEIEDKDVYFEITHAWELVLKASCEELRCATFTKKDLMARFSIGLESPQPLCIDALISHLLNQRKIKKIEDFEGNSSGSWVGSIMSWMSPGKQKPIENQTYIYLDIIENEAKNLVEKLQNSKEKLFYFDELKLETQFKNDLKLIVDFLKQNGTIQREVVDNNQIIKLSNVKITEADLVFKKMKQNLANLQEKRDIYQKKILILAKEALEANKLKNTTTACHKLKLRKMYQGFCEKVENGILKLENVIENFDSSKLNETILNSQIEGSKVIRSQNETLKNLLDESDQYQEDWEESKQLQNEIDSSFNQETDEEEEGELLKELEQLTMEKEKEEIKSVPNTTPVVQTINTNETPIREQNQQKNESEKKEQKRTATLA